MIIREMNVTDIPAIVEIENSCFTHPWSEKSITESFENPSNVFYVAEFMGNVVGYIGLSIMADEGYILNVAVLENSRQKGIGKSLLEKIIQLSQNRKLQFVTLEVRISNVVAISLYEKLGFEKVGKRKEYYNNPKEDALLLTKYLNI